MATNFENKTIINATTLTDGCKIVLPYGPEHQTVRRIGSLLGRIVTEENIALSIQNGESIGFGRISPEKQFMLKEKYSSDEWKIRHEEAKNALVRYLCVLNTKCRENFVEAFARLERLEKIREIAKTGEFEMSPAEKKELIRLRELLFKYDKNSKSSLGFLTKKISINDVDQLIDELLEISLFNKN